MSHKVHDSNTIRRYARRSRFDRVWLWYQDAKSQGVEITPAIYFNVVVLGIDWKQNSVSHLCLRQRLTEVLQALVEVPEAYGV